MGIKLKAPYHKYTEENNMTIFKDKKFLTEGSPEDIMEELIASYIDEEIIGDDGKYYNFNSVEGWREFLQDKKDELPKEIFYTSIEMSNQPQVTDNYDELLDAILQREKESVQDDEEWDEEYVKSIISMHEIISIPYPEYFQYVMSSKLYDKVFGNQIERLKEEEIYPATKKDVYNARRKMRMYDRRKKYY